MSLAFVTDRFMIKEGYFEELKQRFDVDDEQIARIMGTEHYAEKYWFDRILDEIVEAQKSVFMIANIYEDDIHEIRELSVEVAEQ